MLVPHGVYDALIGPYRLQNTSGRGRLSALHIALHPGPEQQTVAITSFTVCAQLAPEAQRAFLSRFTQEASVLATLRHPRIVTIDDYGEQDGIPYFVLSAIIADSLQARLREGSRWNPETVLPLLRQIADALDYAHTRGVVHGGLKPASILLSDDDEAHLTGFGMERLLARHGIEKDDSPWAHLLSVRGSFLGQLEYMAPECIQGAEATFCSDIYALGCILFALLGGEPPLKGTPYEMLAQQIQFPQPSLDMLRPRLIPEVRAALDPILHKALAPEPARRFQRAGELVEAYAQALFPFLDYDTFYLDENEASEEEEEEIQPPDESLIIDANGGGKLVTLPSEVLEDDDTR